MTLCVVHEQDLYCYAWLGQASRRFLIWHLQLGRAKTSSAKRDQTMSFIGRWFWLIRLDKPHLQPGVVDFFFPFVNALLLVATIRWLLSLREAQFESRREVATETKAGQRQQSSWVGSKSQSDRRTRRGPYPLWLGIIYEWNYYCY